MALTQEQIKKEFPEEFRTEVVRLTNYVLDKVAFTAWAPERMRSSWRKRSLQNILREGEINHLFPCVDTAVLANSWALNEDIKLKLLTEKGAVEAFRNGRARALHIDAITELTIRGQTYGFDIGCGDITLLKQVRNHDEETVYLTTRQEEGEHFWQRTPFLSICATDISYNNRSILNFLGTPFNKVAIPYNIKEAEFYEAPDIEGKGSFLDTNQDYDAESSGRDNEEWLKSQAEIFPNLIPYRYI